MKVIKLLENLLSFLYHLLFVKKNKSSPCCQQEKNFFCFSVINLQKKVKVFLPFWNKYGNRLIFFLTNCKAKIIAFVQNIFSALRRPPIVLNFCMFFHYFYHFSISIILLILSVIDHLKQTDFICVKKWKLLWKKKGYKQRKQRECAYQNKLFPFKLCWNFENVKRSRNTLQSVSVLS